MSEEILPVAVALGIGLLLGAERERHKGRGPARGPAGVRTFALVALLGIISVRVGGEVTAAVALAFVALAALAGYVRSGDEDPGLTTEVALVATFLLGALADEDAGLAGALAVVTAVILAERDRLHRLVRDMLTEQELHDGLLFAACAVIVLPLLPDDPIGPHGSINPAAIWRLVVIVMAMQAIGYVALRAIGARYGLLFAGFLGGFISSTATIGAMGARAAREPHLRRGAVAASVASSVATVVLLAIVVGAARGPSLGELALPLALSGAAAVAYAVVAALRVPERAHEQEPERGRAFDLRVALMFAGLVTGVLFLTGEINAAIGEEGVVAGTAVAGFADAQSPAMAAATLATQDAISGSTAVVAVLAALTTNTISKAVVAAVVGKRAFAAGVWPGLAFMLAAAWAGWAATQAW